MQLRPQRDSNGRPEDMGGLGAEKQGSGTALSDMDRHAGPSKTRQVGQASQPLAHPVDVEIAALCRALDRASEASEWGLVREIRADLSRLREERAGTDIADRLVAKAVAGG